MGGGCVPDDEATTSFSTSLGSASSGAVSMTSATTGPDFTTSSQTSNVDPSVSTSSISDTTAATTTDDTTTSRASDTSQTGTTGEPIPCSLDEEFEGDQLDEAIWSSWTEPGVTLEVLAGSLVITPPSDSAGIGGVYTSIGDFHDQSATMVIGTGPDPSTTVEQSMILLDDQDTSIRFTITGGYLYVSEYFDEYVQHAAVEIDTDVHDHLRLAESSGTFYAERSIGDDVWEEVWSGRPPIDLDNISLYARVVTSEVTADPGAPSFEAIRVCPYP